ncbi:GTP-binding protein HflX [Thioflavicoccus mobilis 8321]|uniref:GTPase HflX n=1 Tax=Thioflavicoccus mobilis 8321 TaxID=765912 RepID=L0GZ67_9GAMM|nr:ribosome rescue GTPase HflX [Thioflavicoccus mobilis]AGA91127.1 GTP-binding protein HflX [Thioflavicoccus mobilis 8321]
MLERPRSGEQAVLVNLTIGPSDGEAAAEELRQLADAAGAVCVGTLGGSRAVPDARLFIGSGKAEELKGLVAAEGADLVIFNHVLSPAQQRNLERELGRRVVDRTGLILDIFAQRARSFEGKLQVELAQLEHLATRLVRGWTHLERQKGGIGLRGPGETQLETDRRLLDKRIAVLKRRLARIGAQRDQGRRARRKAELPAVALVGYTNAGKSTLFNRLTGAGVYQADQLFATLDPTLRRLPLPSGQVVTVADTVGFVSDLPHELVAAFRATLEETRSAELLLHVIDAAAATRDRQIEDVTAVLAEIGAEAVPQLQVMNKIDLLEDAMPRVEYDAQGRPARVWLSAGDGVGLDLLMAAIAERCRGADTRRRVRLAPRDGRLRAWLYSHGQVLVDVELPAGGWEIEVRIPALALERLRHRDPAAASVLDAAPDMADQSVVDWPTMLAG